MKKEILLSLSVSLSALGAWAEVNPTDFASEVGEGSYYLYSIEAAKFINTTVNAPSLVDYNQAQPATLTLIDGKYLISGVKDKFIKLGTYRGQYLWSDGDSTSTLWTITYANESIKSYTIMASYGDYTEPSFDGDWFLSSGNAVNEADLAGSYVFLNEEKFAELTVEYEKDAKRTELQGLILQAEELGLVTSDFTAVAENENATLDELNEAVASITKRISDYQENTVTPDNPRDVTSQWIPNSTFDANFEGWISDTGAKNNQVNTTIPEATRNGKMEGGVWENWISSTFQGRMYRNIEGLPNGVYKLQAAAFAYNPVNQFVYANQNKTPITSQVAETYEVFTSVDAHALECGLLAADNSNGWLGLDNVKLFYYGSSKESYSYWANLWKESLKNIGGDVYTDSYMTNLEDKLNEIETATGVKEMAEIMHDAQALNDSLNANISAYSTMSTLRETVDLLSSNVNDYYSAILNADLTSIDDATTERALSTEALNALIDSLNLHIAAGNKSIELQEKLQTGMDLLETTMAEYADAATSAAWSNAEEIQEKASEAAGNSLLTNEEAETILASIQEAIAQLKVPRGEATDENPISYTSYITNASFDNDDNEGWNGTAMGHAQKVHAAECWNMNFDINQDIANLPEGVYTIGLNAFYRAGGTTKMSIMLGKIAYNRLTSLCMPRLRKVKSSFRLRAFGKRLAMPTMTDFSEQVLKLKYSTCMFP